MEEERAICHNDKAIYSCTNGHSAFVNVKFEIPQEQPESHIFSRILTPEGSTKQAYVGLSFVIFNVTSTNDTSIRVKIIVVQPVRLIGTAITCSGNTILVSLESIKSKLP